MASRQTDPSATANGPSTTATMGNACVHHDPMSASEDDEGELEQLSNAMLAVDDFLLSLETADANGSQLDNVAERHGVPLVVPAPESPRQSTILDGIEAKAAAADIECVDDSMSEPPCNQCWKNDSLDLSESSGTFHGLESEDESGATDGDREGDTSSLSPAAERQQQQERVQVKQRRRQKRPKHEVDALRIVAAELEAKAEELCLKRFAAVESAMRVVKSRNLLPDRRAFLTGASSTIADNAVTPSKIWKRVAKYQRQQAELALTENRALMFEYSAQLELARCLAELYRSQHSVLEEPLRNTSHKRARHELVSDDSIIFACMGLDFDVQFARTDAIFDSANLASFGDTMACKARLKRDAQGIFGLETLHSTMTPVETHAFDQMFWKCITNEKLQNDIHESYQIYDASSSTIYKKLTDVVRVNGTEPTVITAWVAVRRYVEAHRAIRVFESIIKTTGSVSIRLHQQGWSIMCPSRVSPPGTTRSGSRTVLQSFVRTVPEEQETLSEQIMSSGVLEAVLFSSNHRFIWLMQEAVEAQLANQFGSLAI